MATNPWAWQEGRNPYTSTAFQILGLDVNLKGRGAIRAHITARRKRVRNAPERFPLFGRVLTEAEVNEAEERIQSPESRLFDELRTHRPRPARVVLDDIETRLAGLAPSADRTRVTVNLDALHELLPPPRRRVFTPLWSGHAAD